MNFQYILATFIEALKGVPTTLLISFFALLASLPLGLLLAIFRLKKIPILSQFARLYTLIIRGTPLILLILMFYSFFPSFLNAFFKENGIGIDIFKVNPLFYACIVFLLVSTASAAEIFRSGLSAIDSGQFEAGYAVGLSSFHIYRRIILPQVFVSALPNICNLAITLVKGTSLVFVMTVKDITAIAKIQASYGYNYAESYLVIFVIYIIICSLIQFIFKKIEQHLAINRQTIKVASIEEGQLAAQSVSGKGKGWLNVKYP
ncbi:MULTISPECIES: amino acid ABC transporter permease [unclassified Enterococcus]|uniref:amino acid ABC transporter permease n=1 Tax=unclassified Enterococcus TaxID=2608891 RepID=UPI001552687D|nr:amino acid ABC transporter permease [Enterococcus sp. MMGLQ5-2]MBS7584743.1 amino acid ABC transporter permease [Enterococcus sp. MMGLQ5-1]NPD12598.1 amino acid ABC transporter permease [Enterococcus sp. MMGLQ5-1]NPD37170.1 amino acid ABC transporter permease [Enterococcus sp. MMGLQ5-2]